MNSNSFGEAFKITTFGESHGPAIGVVIDGVMPGIDFNIDEIQQMLDRRRPGRNPFVSGRKELDRVEVLSGVFEGKTLGTPICLVVFNKDVRIEDYEELKNIFRPGSGDFTWLKKYGIRDWRGGGRASGRETVARVAAGAVAKKQLEQYGIEVFGFVKEIGGIKIKKENFCREDIEKDPLYCPDPVASKKMQERLKKAKENGNSLGGIVEVRAIGVPAGIGDPVFSKLDAEIAKAVMSIGAVKGVEIGDGFKLARTTGFRSNDRITPAGFASNRCGGILAGISTGEPIIVRLAVKPTPSISKLQRTIDCNGNPVKIKIAGRHDPCIAPRIVPVAESMVSLVILDCLLKQRAIEKKDMTLHDLRALIDGCDDVLIETIARRIQIAKKIGEIKKSSGLKIKDLKREKEISNRIKSLAKEYGLSESKILPLFKQVIETCRSAQQMGD